MNICPTNGRPGGPGILRSGENISLAMINTNQTINSVRAHPMSALKLFKFSSPNKFAGSKGTGDCEGKTDSICDFVAPLVPEFDATINVLSLTLSTTHNNSPKNSKT